MSLKRFKTLFNASTATSGNWIDLDVRYQPQDDKRTLIVSLTSGDTIVIEGIVKDVKGTDQSWLLNLLPSEITTIATVTTSGEVLLTSPYTWIRARKTGTTANALVEGFV